MIYNFQYYVKAAALNMMRNPHLIRRYGFRIPTAVAVYVSTVCNRRCVYCPQGQQKIPPQEISDEVLDMFFRRLVEMEWKGHVGITGINEPTLCKKVEPILQRLKGLGCYTSLYSNGDRPETLKRWLSMGLLNRCNITAHQPVSSGWKAEVEEIRFSFPFRVIIRYPKIHDWAGQWSTKDALRIHQIRSSCWSEASAVLVQMDGSYQLCCIDALGKYPQGNIFEKSFMEHWLSKEQVNKRKLLHRGKPVMKLCYECLGYQEAPEVSRSMLFGKLSYRKAKVEDLLRKI